MNRLKKCEADGLEEETRKTLSSLMVVICSDLNQFQPVITAF